LALTVMKSHDDPFLKPARDKKHEKEKGKSHLKEEHKKLETRKREEVEEKDPLRRSRHKVTGIQGIWTQIALQRIFIEIKPAIMP
jgi:hypothetical protein